MNIELYHTFAKIQSSHWWFRARKRIVLSFLGNFRVQASLQNILDIGCGCGYILNDLKQFGTVSGMDNTDTAVAYSKIVFSGDVRKGELPGNVPYADSHFTVITALDVLEHIDADVEALKTIYALLQPNGIAIFTVPACQFLWSSFDDINEHKRRYSSRELETKLSAVGFRIEKLTYYNTFLFPLIALQRLLDTLMKKNHQELIKVPSPVINSILEFIFGMEYHFIKYFRFPIGVSIIAICRKP